MSAGESAIAIIVVFTASLRVVISLQIIVAAAPEREEGREARYVPVINIAQNARPHRAPRKSTHLGDGGGARKRGPFQARRRCSSEDLGRTERTKGVAVVGSITVD